MSAGTRPTRRWRRRRVTAFACLALAASGAMAEDPAHMLQDVGFDGAPNAQLPLDAAFRDASGAKVRLGDYLGHGPAVLVMAYYRCQNLCSVILRNLADSLAAAGLDGADAVDVIIVSIDPTDDPGIASEARAMLFGGGSEPAGSSWHFLTGSAAASGAVADAIGFRYHYDEKTRQYAHAAGITMLTPEGRAARYFYGVSFKPRELRLGLVETAAGTIGTTTDRLLLLCYHYDPTRGRYGFVIQNVLRVAGAATAALIALGLIALLRTERRRQERGTR